MPDYAKVVSNGIKMLNALDPDWTDKVDMDALCLGSLSGCILGQLYGSYEQGTKHLGINSDQDPNWREAQAMYGFDLSTRDYFEGPHWEHFEDLTSEWVKQIKAMNK